VLQVDLEEKKNKAANAGARIARKRRISIFTLLRALDTVMDEAFFEKFVAHFDFLETSSTRTGRRRTSRSPSTWTSTTSRTRPRTSFAQPRDRVARDLPTRASRRSADHRSGPSVLRGAFFSEKRYDLSRVGRYKLDRKLGDEVAKNVELFGDLLERRTSPCTCSPRPRSWPRRRTC